MRALVLSLALAGGVSAGATCYSDATCRLGCCEKSGLDAPCWCSTCCLARSGAPDEIAQLYWDGKRAAFVYRHRIEFYELKGTIPALETDAGKTKALRDEAEARGRPVLLGRDGKLAAVKPRVVRVFKDGIYPFAGRRSRTRAFIVCTAPDWGVSASTAAAETGFCGALSLNGTEVFRFNVDEEGGLVREPIGFSPDEQEAFFALTKKRVDGAREIVGYRLWRKDSGVEALTLDGPRAKTLIDKYEGPFVLPSQQRGFGGNRLHQR